MRDTTITILLDAIVFSRPYTLVSGAFTAFGLLLFPSSCVSCGAWDTPLCPDCHASFRSATARPFRAEAGAESLPDITLVRREATSRRGPPRQEDRLDGDAFAPLPVIAAGRYRSSVSRVLLAYKNHGHVDLAGPAAVALAAALHEAVDSLLAGGADPRPVVLVPVPTRGSSRRRRGYDPVMLLLGGLHRRGNLPAGATVATAVVQVPPFAHLAAALSGGPPGALSTAVARFLPGRSGGQKGLGRRRRKEQVRHSMAVAPGMRGALAGRRCIVVDDVLTTGATIGEVHRVLTDSGALVIGAVVIAATSSPSAGRDSML